MPPLTRSSASRLNVATSSPPSSPSSRPGPSSQRSQTSPPASPAATSCATSWDDSILFEGPESRPASPTGCPGSRPSSPGGPYGLAFLAPPADWRQDLPTSAPPTVLPALDPPGPVVADPSHAYVGLDDTRETQLLCPPEALQCQLAVLVVGSAKRMPALRPRLTQHTAKALRDAFVAALLQLHAPVATRTQQVQLVAAVGQLGDAMARVERTPMQPLDVSPAACGARDDVTRMLAQIELAEAYVDNFATHGWAAAEPACSCQQGGTAWLMALRMVVLQLRLAQLRAELCGGLITLLDAAALLARARCQAMELHQHPPPRLKVTRPLRSDGRN